MTDQTRRLSAEMREDYRRGIEAERASGLGVLEERMIDALHDLDVVDLELVRKLVEALEHMPLLRLTQGEHLQRESTLHVAYIALPVLRRLLAEVEKYRESMLPPDGPGSVVHRGYHNSVVRSMDEQIERLREENARMKAAITKAAEEGLKSGQYATIDSISTRPPLVIAEEGLSHD